MHHVIFIVAATGSEQLGAVSAGESDEEALEKVG